MGVTLDYVYYSPVHLTSHDLLNLPRFLHVYVLSHFSRGQLCATLCQAPLSMGFSRQEYWSGLPCPTPGDLPDPGIEPESLTSPALAGRFFTTSATWEPKVVSLRQAHLTIPYFLILSSSFQPGSLMQYCLPAGNPVPPDRASLSIHHFICNLGMSHLLP